MRRVEYLEKKGIKSIEDMTEEQFQHFSNDVFSLRNMEQYFMLTGRSLCVFEAYDFRSNTKTEFYITQEDLAPLLKK